ncbi:MAG: DUF4301 family protein [Bacteroidales bacterium]|nr:DUF4301 family protein [Bacteroidales bacterium]
MLTEKDLDILQTRGITPRQLEEQLERFRTGFPYLRLEGSATVGNGITAVGPDLEKEATARWDKYLSDGGEVCKFVPASGAASRMFKALFAFVNGDVQIAPQGSDVATLLEHIDQLPFSQQLDETLMANTGKNAAALIVEGRHKDVINGIIGKDGMNYGQLPKGLLTFHRYADGSVRTPLEEQLVEGAQTAAANGTVKVHFTVSAEHDHLFKDRLAEVLPRVEKITGVKYHVGTSQQKPSTDTVAATPANELFRDNAGNIVFRPGGHGALIENLGDIDSAVVFIKNIDNVVPDSHRADTIRYKKIIAGLLILVHDRIESYLRELALGNTAENRLEEMYRFATDTLCIKAPDFSSMSAADKAAWLAAKFNRPLRVCGMVRNEGEPGGGPYIAYNPDGTASPQILESTQIDMSDADNVSMMKNATHFNPVDLVCYIRDIDGHPYDLRRYVDADTGFISEKSQGGRDLRALELPGLWNGAMSDWNTVFVEVPVSTFNPVKTVNDLLRPMHKA